MSAAALVVPPAELVSADVVLGRIAGELARQSLVVAALEKAVERMTAAAGDGLPAELVREFQALDLLRQSLEDLARTAEVASGGATASDLAAALRLRDLAARLFGAEREPDTAGEVSLF